MAQRASFYAALPRTPKSKKGKGKPNLRAAQITAGLKRVEAKLGWASREKR